MTRAKITNIMEAFGFSSHLNAGPPHLISLLYHSIYLVVALGGHSHV